MQEELLGLQKTHDSTTDETLLNNVEAKANTEFYTTTGPTLSYLTMQKLLNSNIQ